MTFSSTSQAHIEGHFAAPEVHAETTNAHVTATFLGVAESISICLFRLPRPSPACLFKY